MERVHFYLLSLGIRAIGVWFFYVGASTGLAFLTNTDGLKWDFSGYLLGSTAAYLLVGTYFLVGAPPALHWITKFPKD